MVKVVCFDDFIYLNIYMCLIDNSVKNLFRLDINISAF